MPQPPKNVATIYTPNPNNALQVKHAFESLKADEVSPEMPLAVMLPSMEGGTLLGVAGFYLHSFPDGTKAVVMRLESMARPFCWTEGTQEKELFG